MAPAERRYALIVLDGLGDRPHPATGGVSPVEAARTPNLDRMAAEGALGEVVVIGPGIAPESDAGVLALLGYDPEHDSPGRGVLEAAGIELPLAPGDVAFRLNFATADGTGRIIDSRVGRGLSTAEAADLARAISDADLLGDRGVRAEVRPTVGHRGVLWLHPTDGSALSPEVSNSDPFYEKVGGMGRARAVENPVPLEVRPLDTTPEAARTAECVNRFLERVPAVLAGHRINARRAVAGRPLANALLVRHAGSLPEPRPAPFASRHALAGAAAITEMPVERGIARLFGLDDLFVGPMGPDRRAAFGERARRTREALERYPFVYVHLKGPDEPGHDGLAERKKEIVETIDEAFFGPFLAGLDLGRTRVAVTADHSTPCILKRHSDDPVPLLLFGAGIPPSAGASAPKFGERAAAAGALGRVRGTDVVPLLLGTGAGAEA